MSEPTYMQDMWAGHSHFTCLACGWDTMGFERLREHFEAAHVGVVMDASREIAEPSPEEVTP